MYAYNSLPIHSFYSQISSEESVNDPDNHVHTDCVPSGIYKKSAQTISNTNNSTSKDTEGHNDVGQEMNVEDSNHTIVTRKISIENNNTGVLCSHISWTDTDATAFFYPIIPQSVIRLLYRSASQAS